jgi:polysaccharide export outer membrane protein
MKWTRKQNSLMKSLGAAALAATLTAGVARGQNTAAPLRATTPAVELKKSPMALLVENEPAADAPYKIGLGDEISVDVAGRPELSKKHVVGPDGGITLPIAGSVKILDKTREEAASAIRTKLSDYYEGVTVSVGVDLYKSNTISVIGAVLHQGPMGFDGTPMLLEAISKAGVPPQVSPSSVQSTATIAPAYPEECIIYRGDLVMRVELRELLEENSSLANYRLMRNDVVFIPGTTKYVSILGQVNHPGTQTLHNASTLTELLADAGGITEKAGRSPVVQIIHPSTDQLEKAPTAPKIQLIEYKAILNGKPLDATLHSGDIIFVPESGFNNVAYVIDKLAPLVNLITVGAILH